MADADLEAAPLHIAHVFRLIDQKFRPHDFSGEDKDWPGFSFVLKGFCSAISDTLRAAMDTAATTAAPIGHLEEAHQENLNKELYYLFVMLCKGKAQEEVMRSPEGCGFEAWRLLTLRYESHARGRKYGLVNVCLNPTIDGADVLGSLNLWERTVSQYNLLSDGTPLPDDIKIAAIVDHSPEPL